MLSHTSVLVITLLLGLMGLTFRLYYFMKPGVQIKKIPVSVNYHLTRQCNYSCGMKNQCPTFDSLRNYD